MALVLDDKVLLKLRTAVSFIPAGNQRLNPQPPRTGVVVAVDGITGDVIVLTEQGDLCPATGDLAIGIFEKIVAPVDSLRDLFLNQIVLPLGYSQEYTARVVDIFQLNDSGTNAVLGTFIVCRTLKGSMYYTVPVTGSAVSDPEILSNR